MYTKEENFEELVMNLNPGGSGVGSGGNENGNDDGNDDDEEVKSEK